jgi:hypothetical protein
MERSTPERGDGAFALFELYSACTGLHRAFLSLPRTTPAFASKVED